MFNKRLQPIRPFAYRSVLNIVHKNLVRPTFLINIDHTPHDSLLIEQYDA